MYFFPFTTRDTVDVETPTCFAMSFRLAIFYVTLRSFIPQYNKNWRFCAIKRTPLVCDFPDMAWGKPVICLFISRGLITWFIHYAGYSKTCQMSLPNRVFGAVVYDWGLTAAVPPLGGVMLSWETRM
jgi:hypothetical protein